MDNGEKSPKELFLYNYDLNLQLNGIIRSENMNYPECGELFWVVIDSISLINGKIIRHSFDYNKEKKLRNEDKQWYRQGTPAITILDYGYGLWTYRKVDKTMEESLRHRQPFIDYSAPDNFNIDISGLMDDYYFYRCESMTEWMPRRICYFPKDRLK